MNNALYVGLSRQMTLKREMDVIANNIANTDTVGYKFESLMLREDVQQAAPKSFSGSQPPEKISFVHDAGVSRDFTQGSLKQTGNAFDLGLQGEGFFEVQTANGNRLTRDGRFTMNAQGQLIDIAGNPVLSSGGQAIRIDPTKTTPSIGHDGTISQDGAVVGKLGIFKVADRTQMAREGGGLFDPNGQTPTVDPATSAHQGMVENANVDAIQQMTRMIAVSRAYEQVSNMMDQTSNTSDESIQRLGRVN